MGASPGVGGGDDQGQDCWKCLAVDHDLGLIPDLERAIDRGSDMGADFRPVARNHEKRRARSREIAGPDVLLGDDACERRADLRIIEIVSGDGKGRGRRRDLGLGGDEAALRRVVLLRRRHGRDKLHCSGVRRPSRP